MTANRRIVLNIVATYGRSLYAMALGLFTARWVLMSLGKVDYGLVGLIGGLTGFVTFLNGLLASAVGRFYAYNVGAAKKSEDKAEGLEECRKWFNTALSIHSVLPVVLVAIGYPIGVWAIENFLTIPADRVHSCIWVWRFTCATCFVGMVNVPFQAMYTAKQEIAELTIYSFATTTLNACFIYYMVSHPGFWLTRYSAWMCFVGIAPALIIAFRAILKYPECRVVRAYLWSWGRIRQLAVFAFARFWSDFSSMFSGQGQSILVNKYMGPAYNAAMTVGHSVASHALTLSSAMDGAFWPAITNKTGEGDAEGVKKLCFMSMRMSTVLLLVFAIPLGLEIKEVLRLWLVNPPDFAAEISIVIMARSVLERMTAAYAAAVYGYGKHVMRYAWSVGWAGISTVFVSWLCFSLGFGMWSIVIGLSFSKMITVGFRLYFGHDLIGFSSLYWLRTVFVPLALLVGIVMAAGLLPRFFMGASFLRVVVTTACCEFVLFPLVWFAVINQHEKKYLISRIGTRLSLKRVSA